MHSAVPTSILNEARWAYQSSQALRGEPTILKLGIIYRICKHIPFKVALIIIVPDTDYDSLKPDNNIEPGN